MSTSKSKFGDISSRKNVSDKAVSDVVNGGQVEIKSKKKAEKARREPFQVMLLPEVKRGIKSEAAMRGITMTELFEEIYEQYCQAKQAK